MTFQRLLILAAACLLAACASTPSPTAPSTPTVLLISMDGVKPDYLGQGDTPRLDHLAHEGVRAQWMNPSYPTLTFPNHYSMVTGLRPDRHGIIHNMMQDAELGGFRTSNREAVGDGRWWGGEPVWVSAERVGLPTATLSWPGSEAPVQGVRPGRWLPFDISRTLPVRVQTALDWLSEPDATRPRLITLYFEQPDSVAHEFGPSSPQLRATLREVDAAIGHLLDGIAARGLQPRVNLVVVSDHGMADVPLGNTLATEDLVDAAEAEVVSYGQVVGIVPRAGREQATARRLLGAHPQYDCWTRDTLPPRWRYGRHPRVPPIVCQMHEGWNALPRAIAQAHLAAGHARGSHGYDPALPSMRAVFLARGPAFHNGVVLPAFDNVDIYPLLMHLLGLPAQPGDGELGPLLPALKPDATIRH
ncbi:alkaline phosphatase family protein [Luteimonas sp. RIT-PG2_3]